MATNGGNDPMVLLAARLESLETALTRDGIKCVQVPATANPGPLGLYGFALTTALLQGGKTTMTEPSTTLMAMGFGFFFGGLAQFCAGLLEYQRKNTFGTVAFCCFGAFWMSLAIYETLVAGGVYKGGIPEEALKMMLSLWGILTFLLWLGTFRLTLATSALFISLSLLFFFLAGGVGTSQSARNWTKFAGAWGLLVAGIAFYDGTAGLLKEMYGCDVLPVYPLGKRPKLASTKTDPILGIKAGPRCGDAGTRFSTSSSGDLPSGKVTPKLPMEV